jgi:uncharacterized protein
MRRTKIGKLILAQTALALGLSAYGCSVLSPQEDTSRYFVLVPVADSTAGTPNGGGTAQTKIGLRPIEVPGYLDRPEVITRLSATEFAVSSTDRWGEPLDASVARVLAQDLSENLTNSEVVPFPWSKKAQLDYTVSVQFSRLEKTADGKAVVQATWMIRSGLDNKLVQKATTTVERSAGSDQRSASEALSKGIDQVSRDIAAALERLPQSRSSI